MQSIETGNLNVKTLGTPEKRGWVLGHFIDSQSLFHSKEAELKWGVHKKGEKYKNTKANLQAKSLAILIEGKVKISFPDTKGLAVLEKTGDFVIWDAGVFHTVEMLEETTILTIRWPSVPNDVVNR